MERTYRGLGFDPTPGELDAVTRTIAQFTDAADALAAVPPALRRAGGLTTDWQGPAADAFRASLGDAPGDLDERERVLRRAAAVLDRWAGVLMANKRRAEELDEQAVRLRRRIQRANDEVQNRQNALDLASTAAAAASASADLAAMTTLVADLERALSEILDKARVLQRDHLRAADAVAAELAEDRGEDAPRPARSDALITQVADLLGKGSRASGALAALLAAPGPARAAAPPAGAAGALAAALSSSGRP